VLLKQHLLTSLLRPPHAAQAALPGGLLRQAQVLTRAEHWGLRGVQV